MSYLFTYYRRVPGYPISYPVGYPGNELPDNSSRSQSWCLVVVNNGRDRKELTARSYLVAVVSAIVLSIARQHAGYALPVVAAKLDDVTTF